MAIWPVRAAAQPSVSLISNQGVVINPVTHKAYAVDQAGNAVFIFDPRTNAQTRVAVGAGPDALAVNVATNRIFVANSGDATISVIDGAHDKVLASIPVALHPYVLAVNEKINRIYVTHTFSDSVTVIDGDNNSTSTVKAGSADFITVDAATNTIYLYGYETDKITVVDGTTLSITNIRVGMHLWGMGLDGTHLYVARPSDAEIAQVDLRRRTWSGVKVGSIPCAVAVNPRTGIAYAVNYGDETVSAIDVAKHLVVTTIHVGHRPQAVAVDVEHNLVFVANTLGDTISVISGTTHKPLATLSGGEHPYGLTVDPSTRKIYVANLGGPSLTVIDEPSFSSSQ